MDSEQEDDDDLNEDEQEEELISEANFTRKKLLEFQRFWPAKFDSQSIESIHGLNRNNNSSIVRIRLGDWKDMSHTWLQDVELSDLNKEVFWIKKELEKLSKFPYFPAIDKKIIFPKRLPVQFPSRVEENYFTAPHFAKSNTKVTVPSLIFGVDSMKLPMSDDSMFEFYGRQCTFECQITNELLNLQSDIVNSISDSLDKLVISENNADILMEIKQSLGLLQDTNNLAKGSNFRAKSFSITSSCKAKLNMRDALLNKVKGDEYIKSCLRGSCFLNEDIFGPIPEIVQSRLDSFSNRSDAKLTIFNKRSGDSLPKRGNPKKRVAVSNYNSQPTNFNANYNSGYNYGYSYPSSSNTNYYDYQVSQSPALFQEKPRPRNSRGRSRKNRSRSRGRGSRQ